MGARRADRPAGALIGIDRDLHGKSAGLRTFAPLPMGFLPSLGGRSLERLAERVFGVDYDAKDDPDG